MNLAEHKKRAALAVAGGLLLMMIGVRLMVLPVFLLAPLVVGFGAWMTWRAVTRLLRISLVEQQMAREVRTEFRRAFDRATLPRQVFWLLLAVAEVDGRAEQEERDLVRQFLLERFTDPVSTADLQAWEAQRLPHHQIPDLIRQLRAALSAAERDTLFSWCCAVAFVDGRFADREHAMLQEIALHLGLSGAQARQIFLHTKGSFVDGFAGADSARSGPRDSSGSHHRGDARDQGARGAGGPRQRRPRGIVRTRAEALQILGLEAIASEDAIRKRHRQLVKQYHPDAHAHLGPIAAEEAAQRFREVQAAYELLLTGS